MNAFKIREGLVFVLFFNMDRARAFLLIWLFGLWLLCDLADPEQISL